MQTLPVGAQATTTFASGVGVNPVSLQSDLGGSWSQVGVGVSGQLSSTDSMFGALITTSSSMAARTRA